MLTIKPIQDKNEQEKLCQICGVLFNYNSLAYRADDGEFIGVCQFYFDSEKAYIENLAYAPNMKDTEAMIIMLRAAMNFLFRCGIEHAYLIDASIDDDILKMSAFSKDENDVLYINLKKFYISPCHYNKDDNKKVD